MAGKKLEYQIGVDSSDAQRGVKDFSRTVSQELKKVEGDFDDTSTAGEKVATVLAKMATDLDAELGRAATAADALRQALGEDLAGRADVGQIVGDLQKMGLSFEDITQDADKLATSLRSLDEVQMKGLNAGLGGAQTSMGKLHDSSDQTRSVMANLVGNTAQDLGALGGAAGSAGVAIGQLAEYAADGNIALGGLVKLAAPMAGLGIATKLVSDHFAEIAETKAFNKDQIEDFAKLLGEIEDDSTAIAEHFKAAGKVEFRMSGDTVDVTENLAHLGLTVEQFGELVESGIPGIDAWRETLLAAGADAHDVDIVTLAASTTHQEYAKSVDLAAVNLKVFGDAADKAAGAVDRLAEANRTVSDPQVARNAAEHADMMLLEANQAQDTANDMEVLRRQLEAKQRADERAKQAVQDHIDALQEEADLALETSDAMQSMADINREIADQQREVNKLAKDEKATVDDRVDASIRLAELQEQQFDTLKKAAGVTATATEKLDAQNRALLGQAAILKGDARTQLLQYIADLNGIPKDKLTNIQTLLDQGKFDEAERKIQRLSENRKATVTFDADTKEADDARERLSEDITTDMLIFPRVGGPIPRFAGGGRVPRTSAVMVGEKGPEIVALPGGSHVYSSAQSRQMMTGSGPSTAAAQPQKVEQHFHQTFNAGAFGDTWDVMRAVEEANRKAARLMPKNP